MRSGDQRKKWEVVELNYRLHLLMVIESCSCRLHWMSIVFIHTHSTAKWRSFSLIGALSQYETGNLIWVPTDPGHKQESLTPSYLLYHCSLAVVPHRPPSSSAWACPLLQLQLLLSFAGTHMVVMIRHVLVVAGLAQLSKTSSSLARSQCCHILLASRSRPSSSPLDKLYTIKPSLVASRLLIASRRPHRHHSTCLTFAINQPKINHR